MFTQFIHSYVESLVARSIWVTHMKMI